MGFIRSIRNRLDSDSEEDILKVVPDWSIPSEEDALKNILDFVFYPMYQFNGVMVYLLSVLKHWNDP